MNPSTSVDFGPFLAQVVWPFVGVLVSVLAAWLAKRLSGWLYSKDEAARAQTESFLRGTFDSVTANALALAVSRLPPGVFTLDLKNQAAAEAARYIRDTSPDLLKRMGATPDALHKALLARIESNPSIPSAVIPQPPPAPPAA